MPHNLRTCNGAQEPRADLNHTVDIDSIDNELEAKESDKAAEKAKKATLPKKRKPYQGIQRVVYRLDVAMDDDNELEAIKLGKATQKAKNAQLSKKCKLDKGT
jgi:hypothetical protein